MTWSKASVVNRVARKPVAEALRQGEDLGRRVTSVCLDWDELSGVQQWMYEQILRIEPATEDEEPKSRRRQADKWTVNLAAAQRFIDPEGHLAVPRKHVDRALRGRREAPVPSGSVGQQPAEQDRRAGP
ncbi:hypothetical protein [Streptomyces goshikiensis]|uniref:hypothetical protein n=1 Tax=Streptomyces goshikiensis TaxID=1942 RepID=UPI0036CDB6FB